MKSKPEALGYMVREPTLQLHIPLSKQDAAAR